MYDMPCHFPDSHEDILKPISDRLWVVRLACTLRQISLLSIHFALAGL